MGRRNRTDREQPPPKDAPPPEPVDLLRAWANLPVAVQKAILELIHRASRPKDGKR